jgi:hypothetical protein
MLVMFGMELVGVVAKVEVAYLKRLQKVIEVIEVIEVMEVWWRKAEDPWAERTFLFFSLFFKKGNSKKKCKSYRM